MNRAATIVKYPDWTCPDCGEENFGSRDACRECSCFRSKAIPSMKPGDWKCKSCHYVNFAKKTVCRCGVAKKGVPQSLSRNSVMSDLFHEHIQKTTLATVKTGYTHKPGDWVCPCGYPNWAKNEVCKTCKAPRVSAVTTTSNSSSSTQQKECTICFVEPINAAFVPCGHLYACETCAAKILAATGTCPICRCDLTGTLKTYSA